MKLNVIKDENGKVVATFENPAVADGPAVRPLLRPGHKVQEIEVADNYKEDLKTLYQYRSR